MKLFVVFQIKAETSEGQVAEVQGVFDNEEMAKSACHGENFCYISINLNEEYPVESVSTLWKWPVQGVVTDSSGVIQ